MNKKQAKTLKRIAQVRAERINMICQEYGNRIAPIAQEMVSPLFDKYPDAKSLSWCQSFQSGYDGESCYAAYDFKVVNKNGESLVLKGHSNNRALILCAHALRDAVLEDETWMKLSEFALGASEITVTRDEATIAAYDQRSKP